MRRPALLVGSGVLCDSGVVRRSHRGQAGRRLDPILEVLLEALQNQKRRSRCYQPMPAGKSQDFIGGGLQRQPQHLGLKTCPGSGHQIAGDGTRPADCHCLRRPPQPGDRQRSLLLGQAAEDRHAPLAGNHVRVRTSVGLDDPPGLAT